ncbi:MAG: protein translocase subunit SecF [Vicinamibacterales bacterium]
MSTSPGPTRSGTSFDFLRWRRLAAALSLLVCLAGGVVLARQGLRLGVEFEGGTSVVAEFEAPPRLADVRRAIDGAVARGSTVVPFGADARRLVVRVPDAGDGAVVDPQGVGATVVEAIDRAGLGPVRPGGAEYVGPATSHDLRRKATLATLASLGGLLAYLTIRYEFGVAVGAVVATLHDLVVTLAFLTVFGYELTLPVIAGLLTVAGYSGNDTIVVFDRVREMRRATRSPLPDVINAAVNQTLRRTVITTATTLLAVLALFFLGGDVLHGLAFTLLVGVTSGVYSTVFIAGTIAAWTSRRRRPPVAGGARVEGAAS